MNEPENKAKPKPTPKLVSKTKLAIMLCWIPLGIGFNAYLTLERGGALNTRWLLAAGATAVIALVIILWLSWYANKPEDE
ncbi:hypothetical protein [Marinicella meishanensis]|uniref:hypothetical protein n=1 Tax=Marinicella meishanensis TaxID=2873263 RepID=UPI001CC0D08E|nr:hypothetical protein [Marinicella sp. NBU2979]